MTARYTAIIGGAMVRFWHKAALFNFSSTGHFCLAAQVPILLCVDTAKTIYSVQASHPAGPAFTDKRTGAGNPWALRCDLGEVVALATCIPTGFSGYLSLSP